VLGDPRAVLVPRETMSGNRRYFRGLVAGSEEVIASHILSSSLEHLVASGRLTRYASPSRAAGSLAEAGVQVPAVVARGICSVSVNSILCSKAVDG
jgi:hypothetical protein